MHKDLQGAEIELLNQGQVDECIEMYQKLFKHDDAIRVAEQSRHPEAAEMRRAHFQYTTTTHCHVRLVRHRSCHGSTMACIISRSFLYAKRRHCPAAAVSCERR